MQGPASTAPKTAEKRFRGAYAGWSASRARPPLEGKTPSLPSKVTGVRPNSGQSQPNSARNGGVAAPASWTGRRSTRGAGRGCRASQTRGHGGARASWAGQAWAAAGQAQGARGGGARAGGGGGARVGACRQAKHRRSGGARAGWLAALTGVRAAASKRAGWRAARAAGGGAGGRGQRASFQRQGMPASRGRR